MKAHVGYYRTAAEKKAIREEVLREYRKIEEIKRREMAERCLKIFIAVLHEKYGFGEKRAKRFYAECGELLSKADTDEVFWEKIDRVVIDKLGIEDFTRDYTEKNKAVRESGWYEEKKNQNKGDKNGSNNDKSWQHQRGQ